MKKQRKKIKGEVVINSDPKENLDNKVENEFSNKGSGSISSNEANSTTSTTTSTTTSSATPTKKKSKKGLFKFIFTLIIVLSLIILGIVIGATVYPKANQWLIDHNFIEVSEDGTTTSWNWDNSTSSQVIYEESTVIDVVQQTEESVVSIAIDQVTLTPDGYTDTSSNIGSGFIVDKDGLILTNQHVVSDEDAIYKVVDSEGNSYEVVTILRDDFNDVALVKIEAKDLKPLSLGDSDVLVKGQMVIAIGTPLGNYAGSVTTGIISGLNRAITASSGFWGSAKNYENVIQTDAAINSGNSGGPLLNSQGEVIGINFATTQGAENISFALPINVAKTRLEEYRVYGKFMKPYIGVQYQTVSEAEAKYYNNVVEGAYVVRVVPASPAEVAGIQKGDFITEINGVKVGNSLVAQIQKFDVGDEITVKVWRIGETLELKVVLGESD